jgi:glycerophosphoryl diester phosphodiesterase
MQSIRRAAAVCLFFWATGVSLAAPPVVIAHRGASSDAPENTLPAIMLGFEQGADFVEVDLYLTADKRIVLIHDKTTKRTGDADLKVAEHTLAELKRVDVGAFKGPAWKGARIPTLEEALAVVPEQRGMFLEIKAGPEIVSPLVQTITQCRLATEQIVLIGFDLPTMIAVKKRLPDHLVYWLVSFKQDQDSQAWKPSCDEILSKAVGQVDGINLKACDAVDQSLVERAGAAGLPVYVWTVNDDALADQMRAAGVAGITTDRPKWLKQRNAATQ